MARHISLSRPAGDPILDQAEASLVERSLNHLRRVCPRDAGVLWAQLKRLGLLGSALEQTPSLYMPSTLGASTRDETTLVLQLSHLDPLGGELALPEKAVIAHAFLMAKISLLRAFLVSHAANAPGSDGDLHREFREELAQSVYTAIASEILLGLLSDPAVMDSTKVRAARQLILIWERATHVEIDDFCPMLESAWEARSHLTAGFGALLGTSEYMRLVQENCSPQFLEFFTRDQVTRGETQAFEEFLFNVTWEDLERLRLQMGKEKRGAIDPAYAARVLERPMAEIGAVDDPEALYRSYRRRRTAAEFRRLTKASGPLRVAEAYLMVFVLDVTPSGHTSPEIDVTQLLAGKTPKQPTR